MSPNTAMPNPVPRTVFDEAARSRGFVLDPAQHDAVEQLCHPERPNVYLWGPPGRGKSWLADVYFSAYPGRNKLRVHFHEFFRDLHVELRRHRFDLDAALDHLIGRAELVCFDEFHVHDPADGTFVARLFPALLGRRTRLVLTSNYPPRDLLPNPLFHDGFVPTIELVERCATVVALDGPRDHRLGSDHAKGFASGIWPSPRPTGSYDGSVSNGRRRPNIGSCARRNVRSALYGPRRTVSGSTSAISATTPRRRSTIWRSRRITCSGSSTRSRI